MVKAVFDSLLDKSFSSLPIQFDYFVSLLAESPILSESSEIDAESQITLFIFLLGLLTLGAVSLGLVILGFWLLNRRRALPKQVDKKRGIREDDWSEKPLVPVTPELDKPTKE